MTRTGERETNHGQFRRLSRRPDRCQPRYHQRAASDAGIAAGRETVYAVITAAIAASITKWTRVTARTAQRDANANASSPSQHGSRAAAAQHLHGIHAVAAP